MATSQKSRDREKWLSFPTKNKKISRCHIISRDYPFILTFQQIPCNQKENHLKFKRKFETPVFGTPRLSSAKMVTSQATAPVEVEFLFGWKKALITGNLRIGIGKGSESQIFYGKIYLVGECIKLICCVMYCFKILEKEKKTKTAFWYLWVSWVWTRVLRSSTLCLSMFIYVWFCQDPNPKR